VAGPAYGYPFYRPIWAPAYVSFFGFGGFGFGGWGGIGWLPLGRRLFHPWWTVGGYGFGRLGENRGGFAPLRAGSRFSNVNLAMHNANFAGDVGLRTRFWHRPRNGSRCESLGDAECAFRQRQAGSDAKPRELLGQRTRGGVVNHAKRVAESALLLGPWRDGNGVERQVVE